MGRALFRIASAAFGLGMVLSGTINAQDVRLFDLDGGLRLEGTLLSAENGWLVVRTDLGETTIDQAVVTCEGEGCPVVEDEYALTVAGPGGEIADDLIPTLANGYAEAFYEAEVVMVDEDGEELDEEAEGQAEEFEEMALELINDQGEVVSAIGVQEVDSDAAFDLIAEGAVEVVFSDSSAPREAVEEVRQSGGGDLLALEQERVIAVDGLAVIVHPDNPLSALTIEQVAQIYAGDIRNWSAVGGPDAPVTVYSFSEEAEGFHQIRENLLEPLGRSLAGDVTVVETHRDLTNGVLEDPNGIAITGFAKRRGARALALTDVCGMTTEPNIFTIKTEEYPLQYRVFAYSRADAGDMGREMLNFIDGPDLDGLVSKAGFTDLSVVVETEEAAKGRMRTTIASARDQFEFGLMQDFLLTALDYQRVSTTFRFAPGSSLLDNKATRDLSRVASFVKETRPSEVLVVGFTDSLGAFEANQFLSEQRARTVLGQITESTQEGDLDGIDMQAIGYGELAPVACNESLDGRSVNRRVEIWVR